mmetsp:Transcript_49480/g.112386  ORF Transcript_49480/g.112386 Transcript_49480/m.112386 type:complete len:251 (+) Transcript_49480:496-1248(+)
MSPRRRVQPRGRAVRNHIPAVLVGSSGEFVGRLLKPATAGIAPNATSIFLLFLPVLARVRFLRSSSGPRLLAPVLVPGKVPVAATAGRRPATLLALVVAIPSVVAPASPAAVHSIALVATIRGLRSACRPRVRPVAFVAAVPRLRSASRPRVRPVAFVAAVPRFRSASCPGVRAVALVTANIASAAVVPWVRVLETLGFSSGNLARVRATTKIVPPLWLGTLRLRLLTRSEADRAAPSRGRVQAGRRSVA